MKAKSITDTFSTLRHRLKTLASSMLRDEDEADDVLQEAFCKMWINRSKMCHENAEAVAVLAVKQVCINFLRKRAVRANEDIDENTLASHTTSDSLWETQEMEQLKKRLLSALTPIQREVFNMVSDGIDNDIIAQRLGISEESVRQHLCRARKTLKSQYRKL